MNKKGFVLIEALAAVVIVSICLTLIIESFWTNTRISGRFAERTRALIEMENRLGALLALRSVNDRMPKVHPFVRRADVAIEFKTLGKLNVTTLVFTPPKPKPQEG